MQEQRGIVRAAGLTDVGLRRKVNQDDFYYNIDWQLFIVADGMGGHKAGNLASQIAVQEILAYLQAEEGEERTPTGREDVAEEPRVPVESIVSAIQTANRKICAKARESRDYFGMGTTIVVVQLVGDQLVVAHAGDSRLYRLRGGKLEAITKDHSRVQELIDMEKLTVEEAERYPDRNVITRALGGDIEIKVDSAVHELDPEDVLMLCTDGLSSVVPHALIEETKVKWRGDPQRCCEELVAAAKRFGAPDNVTVIVAEAAGIPGVAAESLRGCSKEILAGQALQELDRELDDATTMELEPEDEKALEPLVIASPDGGRSASDPLADTIPVDREAVARAEEGGARSGKNRGGKEEEKPSAAKRMASRWGPFLRRFKR